MPDDLEGCTFEPAFHKPTSITPAYNITAISFKERLENDEQRRKKNQEQLITQLDREYKAKYGNGKPVINSNASKLASLR